MATTKETLDELELFDSSGQQVKGTAVLPTDGQEYSFLLKIQALAPLAGVLSSSKTRIVFIGSSTPDQMKEYLQRTTIPICGDLFTDPQVSLYKYFQLKRGVFRSLVRPFFTAFTTYGVKGVVEGIRLAKETSHLAGDSWQQGGTVLLDRNQTVLYQHTEEHPADWPSMEEVLRIVGVTDKKVDYKQALAEWLKAREEQRAQAREEQHAQK